MNIRFYLDPETGSPHIYGHAVDEDEVEEVLRPRERIGQGARGRESLSDKREQAATCA